MKSYTITVNGTAYEVTRSKRWTGCKSRRQHCNPGIHEDGDPGCSSSGRNRCKH